MPRAPTTLGSTAAALLLLASCLPPGGEPLGPDAPADHPLVSRARAFPDAEYAWGGRMEAKHPNLDCLGLVFVAYQEVYGTPWRRHSVNPTELARSGTLGRPVPGLDGVATADLDLTQLRPGDVVFALRHDENPKEPALATVAGQPAWVWHVGIFAGGGDHRFLHADPFHDRVVEVPLIDYLDNFWLNFVGIYVLRPPAP